MNRLWIQSHTLPNRVSYWHLACFLILLPFDLFYSEIVLISFAIHTLIHAKRQRMNYLLSKEMLLVTAVYFVGLLTIAYSPDKAEGLAVTGRQTALLLLPVLLVIN